jgi:hypothetical protein
MRTKRKKKKMKIYTHKSTRIRGREGDESKKNSLFYLPHTLRVYKNVTAQKHTPC